ncbi:MAG: hypothetical protein AAGG48_19980 [Planctomycetota bacterium]
MLKRIRSPRRLMATSLAVAFFCLYLLNGVFILSSRAPADPERLRLWLSGGMVLYAMYHGLRCVWSSQSVADLELTPAEDLWLGGAPVRRSSLAIYHVGSMVVPSMLKTALLVVVLAMDVRHVSLLAVGVFCSLVLLEIIRLIIARWSSGIDQRQRKWFRVAVTCVAGAAAIQVFTRMIAITPMGSPTLVYLLNGVRAMGQTAASEWVQWMSVPWLASANLAVHGSVGFISVANLMIAIGTLPLAILLLVRVDRWSHEAVLKRERNRLAAGEYITQRDSWSEVAHAEPKRWRQLLVRLAPNRAGDAIAMMSRQWVSVVRYRGTILFSFALPTLLCLSPLATGQENEQWLFVVGGIAMCTMLLAPPALRIDFRRDLKRMLLLRSLPVNPMSMVIGQLALPVLITWMYQWFTLAIAVIVVGPGLAQTLMWTSVLSALAVFTFAVENAMFLAYPHHEHAEGVAMMIRAKLTFLGKATIIALSVGMLVAWAVFCRSAVPSAIVTIVFVAGAMAASWLAAILALFVAQVCWRRYDLCHDIPPS